MKRSKQELLDFIASIDMDAENEVQLLEDISDSINDDYDSLLKERDEWKEKAINYRDKYINRFYDNYDKDGSIGYVNSSAPQAELEDVEEKPGYMELFE